MSRHALFRTGLAGTLIALVLAACTTRPAEVPEANLIQVDDLARQLADTTAQQPVLLHVGFASLYRSGHIPGSRYMGAGNTPQGLSTLRQTLDSLPPDQPVVLYCGCCPWQDCPNIRPAFQVAKESGRENVRVLHITGNLERDWIAKGLPSTEGEE